MSGLQKASFLPCFCNFCLKLRGIISESKIFVAMSIFHHFNKVVYF